jgi:uncharacterized protein YndB with AHSA1/START domain
MNTTDLQSPAAIERSADGVTLRFDRSYDQSRDVVWRALTDPTQLEQWLDRSSVDLRVDGEFVVHFDDGEMRGRITHLEPGQLLAYSWHEGEYGESHVRWDLSDRVGGGTDLRLTHVRLRDESASGFAAGWHHHIERLGGLLSGGSTAWSGDRFEELHGMYRRA